MMNSNDKIYIAGHNGMVGSAMTLKDDLKETYEWFITNSKIVRGSIK